MRIPSVILCLVLLVGCRDDSEENFSIIGNWNVKSYRYKEVISNEVNTDETFLEVGTFFFDADGTGEVDLRIKVSGIPDKTEIQWSEIDSTGQITINYNDGSPDHTYLPSYRGRFILLSGTRRIVRNNRLVNISTEILYERK